MSLISLKGPMPNLKVPLGYVPIVSWASGAQWRPVLVVIPYSLSKIKPNSELSIFVELRDMAAVLLDTSVKP